MEETIIHDFPFLVDEATITHIKRSKVMFIMRGLPGSGKSTIVSEIKSIYPDSAKCSADDFFMNDEGGYDYDKTRLSEAHEQCHTKCEHACESGRNVVIIDNTNIRLWETKFYIGVASKHDYCVHLVSPRTPWRNDPEELSRRNKHNVPVEEIVRKLSKFDEVYPWYWAWCLNTAGSDRLEEMGRKYFSLCVEKLDELRVDFSEITGVEERAMMTLNRLYRRDGASTTSLHCTAYYNGMHLNPPPATETFSKSSSLQKAMGRADDLHVIGFVITPRTVGARVALKGSQIPLWGKDDDEGLDKAPSSGAFDLLDGLSDDMSQVNLDDDGPYENLKNNPRFAPMNSVGRRAHITLGWAPFSKAVQTGLDQIQVTELELQNIDNQQTLEVEVEGAYMRYYGDGQCVVYLNEPISVGVLFSGCY